METIDKRASIFELDEIYKYKNLIETSDNVVIKQIIYDGDEQSNAFYSKFIKLVSMEIDHQLNKTEFSEKKDELILKMKQHLENKKV